MFDPAGGTTLYAYDAGNNLTQVTDPRGLATTYTYDGLGNLTRLVSPDTGITNSTFDAAGNVLTRIDARAVTASYTMDALNRVAAVVYSKSGAPNESHTFSYDSGANAKGRLTQLADPAATTSWTYTPQGRVASKAQTAGGLTHTLSYGYNAAGQLTTVTTPSGQQIAYTYLNNRVASITVNGGPLVNGIVTTPFGPSAAWQWGNGLYTFRDYDGDGRLNRWTFRNGADVLRNDLTFDAASRITAIANPVTPTLAGVYQYDTLDRLTVAQQGSPVSHTQQFGYDALGNRTSATVDGGVANLYYGSNTNQLQSMIGTVQSGLSQRCYRACLHVQQRQPVDASAKQRRDGGELRGECAGAAGAEERGRGGHAVRIRRAGAVAGRVRWLGRADPGDRVAGRPTDCHPTADRDRHAAADRDSLCACRSPW